MEIERELKRKQQTIDAQKYNKETSQIKQKSMIEGEAKQSFEDKNAVGEQFNNKLYEVRWT